MQVIPAAVAETVYSDRVERCDLRFLVNCQGRHSSGFEYYSRAPAFFVGYRSACRESCWELNNESRGDERERVLE